MSKKSLIVVHGMGNHSEASTKQEVTEALKTVALPDFVWAKRFG